MIMLYLSCDIKLLHHVSTGQKDIIIVGDKVANCVTDICYIIGEEAITM